MTHALYLLDPEPTAQWAPFAGARPVCELRAGAHLIRERWEAFVGSEAAGIFALPHLAGFVEPGVPAVLPRRAVTGPAVIGSSTFAPEGLAPALPGGTFRFTAGGITVGWGVGPGVTWDGPQPQAAPIEVKGVVLHGVHALIPALERLLPGDVRALLGDTDPIPAGSTVLGDPAALALRDQWSSKAGPRYAPVRGSRGRCGWGRTPTCWAGRCARARSARAPTCGARFPIACSSGMPTRRTTGSSVTR
jgi:hypothetical protein